MTRCSWSSRTATASCARCWSTNWRSIPAKLTRVLHFDGTPITARFISDAIADKVDELKVVPFRKAVP